MGKLGNVTNLHAVTMGDYPMVAPDLEVFKKAGRRVAYNLAVGQLVAYVQENGTTRTIDASNITAADIPRLFIGVGHDSTGNGVVDSIRHIGSEHISGCDLKKTSTSSPSCGAPEVHDFYFGCTECEETYSVMVTVDDNETRSFAPFMKSGAEFVGSVVTECHGCDDCPKEHNCKEIACKMADALNADCELRIGDERYPDWKGDGSKPERPFFATRLHERSLIYCIAPASEDCEDCNHIPAITGATVIGEPVELYGNVNPADPSQTLLGQVKGIVEQINEAFREAGGHQGSAYLTGGAGSDCCPLQIHVNTCDTTFAIDGATPTVEENPFDEYASRVNPNDCIDCGEDATETVFTCGIRIIAAPIETECGCLINQPLSFYGRKITIKPIGEGWTHGQWVTKKIQDLELPSGFGSHVQWLELKQTVGGEGRKYRSSSQQRGWLNQFDKKSRVVAAPTADCKKSYCSWYLQSEQARKVPGGVTSCRTIDSTVHVPTTDDTTITSWMDFYTTLLELSPGCIELTPEPCLSDGQFGCTT